MSIKESVRKTIDEKNMLRLYYTWRGDDKAHSQIDDSCRDKWLHELPADKKEKVSRLLHKRDQDSSLLGLQLLKYCAREMQLDGFKLADIQYPVAGKPVWQNRSPQVKIMRNDSVVDDQIITNRLDFNISHSNNLIMLVASKNCQVGVDVEKIRALKSLAFKSVMQAHELEQIKKQPALFFKLWSIKEAVVKAADTAGLSRMLDVIINNGECVNMDNSMDDKQTALTANFESMTWQLKIFDMDDGSKGEKFSIAVAASLAFADVSPQFVSIDALK